MKKRILIVLGCLVFSLAFATNAFAANSNGDKSSIITPITIDAELIENAKNLNLNQANTDGSEQVGIMGPAPALSYLQIRGVQSSDHPEWEDISDSQVITVEDHGGAEMYVATIEQGYGNIPIARMNGSLCPLVLTEYYDLNGDTIIETWVNYWDASGHNSGTFTYENTSSNYPYNNMWDQLNIR